MVDYWTGDPGSSKDQSSAGLSDTLHKDSGVFLGLPPLITTLYTGIDSFVKTWELMPSKEAITQPMSGSIRLRLLPIHLDSCFQHTMASSFCPTASSYVNSMNNNRWCAGAGSHQLRRVYTSSAEHITSQISLQWQNSSLKPAMGVWKRGSAIP